MSDARERAAKRIGALMAEGGNESRARERLAKDPAFWQHQGEAVLRELGLVAVDPALLEACRQTERIYDRDAARMMLADTILEQLGVKR